MKENKIKRTSQERIRENERSNIATSYLSACEMMGIDPDNNPNYKTDSLPNHLYDKAGNPIKITVTKPTHLIPMTQLTEHVYKILSGEDKIIT